MQRDLYDPQFAQAIKNFKQAIDQLGTKPFCIYGTGRHSTDMIECCADEFIPKGANFIGFISDTDESTNIFQYPIYHLHQALAFYPAAIVLGTDTWQEQMGQKLKTQGFCGQLIDLYPKTLDQHECANTQVLIIENTNLCQIDFETLASMAGKTVGNTNTHKLAKPFMQPLQSEIEPLLANGIENVFYKGINLFELSRGSISCALNTTEPSEILAAKSVCEYFVLQTAAIFEAFSHIFSQHKSKVQTVIYPNGFWHHTQALRAAAEKYGINTLAVELSFFPHLVYVEPFTGKVANDTALSLYSGEYLKKRTPSPEQKQQVAEFFASRCPEKEIRPDGFGQPPAVSPSTIRDELGIPAKARICLALMQVVTDTTIVYDNPLYKDNISFIEDLAEWYEKHPDEFLVIKPHPKELKGISPVGTKTYANTTWKKLSEKLEKASDNIILLRPDQYNVYALFETADIGITINSQSGFEMLAQTGKNVVVLGKAAYAGKGFSVDVDDRSKIPQALEKAFENNARLSPAQQERLEVFAWHMLFEYLYPLPLENHPQKQQRLVKLLKGPAPENPEDYFHHI